MSATFATKSSTGSKWLIGFAIIIPLALLVGLSFQAGKAVRQLRETNAYVNYLEEAERVSSSLFGAMVDNEAGQRGYLLTQNALFLEPYNKSLEMIPKVRQTLASMNKEPHQAELLDLLNRSIDQRLAFSAMTVDLQRKGNHEQSLKMVQTGEGKRLMDQVRADWDVLQKFLRDRSERTPAEYADHLRQNQLVSWMMVGLHAAFLVGLFFILRRLQRGEQFVHICAWSRTIEYEGEWITFEDYLARKFAFSISHGISPSEARKLLDFKTKAA